MMKLNKIWAFMMGAIAITACSSEDIEITTEKPAVKRMTLKADVSQTLSRGSFSDVTSNQWDFSFSEGDKVMVNYVGKDDYFTFTKTSAKFESEDASPVDAEKIWYAYYPSSTINLTNQAGTPESAAQLYALAGTSNVPANATDLSFTMNPKVAIVKITNNRGVPFDLFVSNLENRFVGSLTASNGTFTVNYTDDAESFCTIGAGKTCYVVVPAGIGISFWDEAYQLIKKTKATGLVAGNYYSIVDNSEPYVEFNGVKWATRNVGASHSSEIGDYFAWGETTPRYGNNNDNWSYSRANSIDLAHGTLLSKATDDPSYYTLNTTYDAAAQSRDFGTGWRVPSAQDFKDLFDGISAISTASFNPNSPQTGDYRFIENGVEGLLVVHLISGTNYKSLFFPYSGYYDATTLKETDKGFYATSDLRATSKGYKYVSYFSISNVSTTSNINEHNAYWGHVIRPVYGTSNSTAR